MSLDLARHRLFEEFKVLRQRWESAKQSWQDSVRVDFEKEHWQPLEDLVINALAAMDRVGPLPIQIRQECGED